MTLPSSCSTISDIDAVVERKTTRVLNGSPIGIIKSLSNFEHHLLPTSPDFARLHIMKEHYRFFDGVEDKFRAERQHNRAALSSSDAQYQHLKCFHSAFNEIANLTNPPLTPVFKNGTHFLDLGCAPGGFSTWLLQNTNMQGVGITLPWQSDDRKAAIPRDAHSGIPLCSSLAVFADRFAVYLRNLATDYLSTGLIPTESIPPSGFDLVIANASVMLSEEHVSWGEKIKLIFAQLFIAFQHIAIGGTLIISLRTRPFDWIVDIIAMLKMSFESVDVVKPSFQAKISFAYFVCQGFSVATVTEQRLRRCIQYLQDAETNHLELDTTKMPRVSQTNGQLTDQEVNKIFTTAWKRQYTALRTDLECVLNNNQSGPGKPYSARRLVGYTIGSSAARSLATSSRGADSANWREHAPARGDAQEARKKRRGGFKDLPGMNGGGSGSDGLWRKIVT